MSNPEPFEVISKDSNEYVTAYLAGQLVGIPVLDVHDVLKAQKLTPVPLAPDSIAGVMNLRGKIVTAVDLRTHLGFEPREEDEPYMSVVIEYKDVPYSLMIDKVGDVISVPSGAFERNPVTLDSRLKDVSNGVYQLEDALLIILDVDKLLNFDLLMVA